MARRSTFGQRRAKRAAMIATILACLFSLLAAVGTLYMLAAAAIMSRLAQAGTPHGAAEPVTLLKPLHGPEPRLAANLATFFAQDWPAEIEMVAGVSREDDPAAEAASTVGATLVVDPTRHGANGKVSNLINMMRAARHDLLVLSDSDMSVSSAYLRILAGALAKPGVGAVSCLYRGRSEAGGWSVLAAAGISYQFLPSVAMGVALGLAKPCMGSTIALRRATLDAIGGFERVADKLADDYEIGAAVRALGFTVAVPPMIVTHGCDETSFSAIWRHERRWAITVRRIDPAGNLGQSVTHPFAWALLTLPFAPLPGLALMLAALGSRLVLKGTVDRAVGASSAPFWMIPFRDCVSFATYLGAFVARNVDWRGEKLTMLDKGRVSAERSSPR
jgi:ceramide glucosyltransferase